MYVNLENRSSHRHARSPDMGIKWIPEWGADVWHQSFPQPVLCVQRSSYMGISGQRQTDGQNGSYDNRYIGVCIKGWGIHGVCIKGWGIHSLFQIRHVRSPPQQVVQCSASTRPDTRFSGTSTKGSDSDVWHQDFPELALCLHRSPYMGIKWMQTDKYRYLHIWA